MGSRKEKADQVYQGTDRIISKLSQSLDTPKTRADLANIRKSINRPMSQSMDAWAILFEDLPLEILGKGEELNDMEQAILFTVQMYALHQQGKKESVQVAKKEQKFDNLGQSLRALREDHQAAVDRRFNSMITASSFEELAHHLRQLIQLLKSRTDVGINYPILARDVYYFISGYDERVRLNWARAYYYVEKKKEGEKDHE